MQIHKSDYIAGWEVTKIQKLKTEKKISLEVIPVYYIDTDTFDLYSELSEMHISYVVMKACSVLNKILHLGMNQR